MESQPQNPEFRVHFISLNELCFCLRIQNYRACNGNHVSGISVYS